MIVCLGQWGTIMKSCSMGCASVESCETDASPARDVGTDGF